MILTDMRPHVRSRRATISASLVVAALFGVTTLPTPVYPFYAQRFSLTPLALTGIFALYVAGTLVALVGFGRLSDQIGRRPVVLVSCGLLLAALAAFVVAHSVEIVALARTLTGLGVGLAAGAATAWIAELEPHGSRDRSAALMASASLAGEAVAALIAGVALQAGPGGEIRAYGIGAGVIALAGIVAWRQPETVKPLHSLRTVTWRPRIGIPKGALQKFAPAGVIAFVIFALLGYYSAVTPQLLARDLSDARPAMSGAVAAAYFGGAAVVVIIFRSLTSRRSMVGGVALMIPAALSLLLAAHLKSLALLLASTAIAAVSTGLGYRGSLQVVNKMADGNSRAELLASYMVCASAGLAIPVLGVGVLSQATTSSLANAVFAMLVVLLAVAALLLSRHARFPGH